MFAIFWQSFRSGSSPTTSPSPPANSTFDSLISSFSYRFIKWRKKRNRPTPPVCSQQKRSPHHPSPFSHMHDVNERERGQFQSLDSRLDRVKHLVLLLYNTLVCLAGGEVWTRLQMFGNPLSDACWRYDHCGLGESRAASAVTNAKRLILLQDNRRKLNCLSLLHTPHAERYFSKQHAALPSSFLSITPVCVCHQREKINP